MIYFKYKTKNKKLININIFKEENKIATNNFIGKTTSNNHEINQLMIANQKLTSNLYLFTNNIISIIFWVGRLDYKLGYGLG